MRKLLIPALLGSAMVAHVARAYSGGAGSCTMPSHGAGFTAGNGGFMVEFIDITVGSPYENDPVTHYIAGNKYQVIISNSVNYKGFLAGFTTGMDLGSGSMTGLHLGPNDDQDIQTASLGCAAMTHTSARRNAPRMMDKFTWQSPGSSAGNLKFHAIGVKEKLVFHKFSVWFNETWPTLSMTDTSTLTLTRTPTKTKTPTPIPMSSNSTNSTNMTGCMAHMTCGGCSMDNMCRWCASTGMCEPKDMPTQCKSFGCLKCGTQLMPNYICNPESVDVGGMCKCRNGATKWCNNGMCQPRAGCGTTAAAHQPCTANTIRDGGAPITQAANCVCRTLFSFTPTCGSPSGPPCKLDAGTILGALAGDTSNTPFNLPDGSNLDLSSNLNLGTAMLKFGTGAASETGAATSTTGLRTIVSQSVDFDVEEFESSDVEFDVTNINFKRAMSWAGARCKVGGLASFEADVTFSGTGGNFEISASGSVTTDPGTRVAFGTGFDLKMGGSFTAGGPLEFGSPEEVSVVKIDGTLTTPEEIVLNNDADIQISGTIDAVDPANPPTIRGYGCNFHGNTGAIVNGVVEFYPKATSSSGRHRRAVAQVEDSTGYSNTLGGATVHNAFIDADDTWVNPGAGFMVNAGMRLHSSSALYFSDAFDLAAANFGGSWNGLMVTGTVTLDNCAIVLDMGDSTGGGSFPSTDPFVLLEADAIVGTAFITVAADEGMGATTMWSAKIVANGARWQLQAHRHAAATWADPSTNIRSKLWGVYIKKADWPTLDASNFASTLDTSLAAVWQKNAAAWQASGFYMSEVHKIETSDPIYSIVYFTYNAPSATLEYINDVIVNLFRYEGAFTFYAASPLKAASSEFQCATSDDPAAAAPVYACHPDYFAAHGACMAQALNDATCGAARKEKCTVKPSDSPHCFLVE